MEKFKIVDLFSGAGGLSLGFENAGFESVLALDMWNDAIDTYNYNRKNKVGVVSDIASINSNFLKKNIKGKINGVIGGPPCQGFSLAGKRSVDDVRNQLYKEYFRVLNEIKPDFFVLENVAGILNLDNGKFKDAIIKNATDIGYHMFVKKLIASDYGVPQNRVRVFFIGIKNEKVNDEFEFPKKHDLKITSKEALSDLPLLKQTDKQTKYSSEPKNEYQKIMRKNSKEVFNHENSKHTEETIELISHIPEGGSIKDLPEKLKGDRKYSSLLRRMNSKEPSNTIDTGHRTYFHYKENRIITVREAARLQSFPDNYFFTGGKQSQYKQVGNAVPPILAKEVALSIIKYLYK